MMIERMPGIRLGARVLFVPRGGGQPQEYRWAGFDGETVSLAAESGGPVTLALEATEARVLLRGPIGEADSPKYQPIEWMDYSNEADREAMEQIGMEF